MSATSPLMFRTLADEAQRHAAAVAAIEARSGDIAVLDHLATALQARGWQARAVVTTEPVGAAASCVLSLWLSATAGELADIIEHLGRDGVSATRIVHCGPATLRHYTLWLAGFQAQLFAQLKTAVAQP